MTSGAYDRIYAAVNTIPQGRVAAYGQVASAAGFPGHARMVGYALHALPEHSPVPWHRVINARGRISLGRRNGAEITQRLRLESEGVRFDAKGVASLEVYGWRFGALA